MRTAIAVYDQLQEDEPDQSCEMWYKHDVVKQGRNGARRRYTNSRQQ